MLAVASDENGSAALDWRVLDRHSVKFRYAPFEQRDVGVDRPVAAGTVFGDYTFPVETPVRSIFFAGDLRGRYAFELVPDTRFSVEVGGGLSLLEGELSLFELDPATGQTVPDTGDRLREVEISPLLYLQAGVDLTGGQRYFLYAEADTIALSGGGSYDATAKFKYRINSKWDVAGGWRWTGYDVDTSELETEFESSGWAMHAAYSF